MRKINRRDAIKLLLVLALIAGAGFSLASIGRFSPTHAIVEPVYCGSCHVDQIKELNATTHLPHFAGAIYEIAEERNAGGTLELTQAEAVSGACMMCHNTWANRDKLFVNNYTLIDDPATGQYTWKYNDVVTSNSSSSGTKGTLYDVRLDELNANLSVANSAYWIERDLIGALPYTITVISVPPTQTQQLNASNTTVTVKFGGTSGIADGTQLTVGTDYNLVPSNNPTGVEIIGPAGLANSGATILVTGDKVTVPTKYVPLSTGGILNTTAANRPTIVVQDPGGSGLPIGYVLAQGHDFNTTDASGNPAAATLTGVTFNMTSQNVIDLNTSGGAVKITYSLVNTPRRSLKEVWGELSAKSPTPGVFISDQNAAESCGNPEKGFCHAVETSLGLNMVNGMPENNLGVRGSGIYFQHEMAYTSAEYAAKQVKLCAVCHVNKLPPMTADGEPIRQDVANGAAVIRVSHGEEILNTTSLTTVSSDWAHKQVQCIRCHGHAGIGGTNALTGVRSP